MLVLTRKIGEQIYLGNNVCITVVEIAPGKVRLGIDAPKEMSVHRKEVYELINGSNHFGATNDQDGNQEGNSPQGNSPERNAQALGNTDQS